MSMPDETPAAVITLPRCTTRSGTGTAPRAASSSCASQWVAASTPSRIPAAASSSEPVHTDVVQRLWAWASRSQASTAASASSARLPKPPGTTTTSGRGCADSGASAVSARLPCSVRLGPGCAATRVTSAPGMRASTS